MVSWQDDDRSAYIAYSSEDNKVMHIAQLTRDYTDVGKEYIRTMVGPHRLLSAARHFPPPICLPSLLERRGLRHQTAGIQRKAAAGNFVDVIRASGAQFGRIVERSPSG